MKESGWYCQGSACYTNALQEGGLEIAFMMEMGHTEWGNGASWQPAVSCLITFNLQCLGCQLHLAGLPGDAIAGC
jgi:hypothetical protein